MELNLDKEEDRFIYVLNRLCEDIREGSPCPTSEMLTSALRGLFPRTYLPEGTGIAIFESPNPSWYADVVVQEVSNEEVTHLRRKLTSYIVVKRGGFEKR